MPASTVQHIRRGLALILTLALTGTITELLLIEHDETAKESIPLFTLFAAAGTFLLHLLWRTPAARRLLQFAMLAMVVTGLLGTYFHYEANAEWETEMDPDLVGFDLVLASFKRTSPPPFAPGALAQIGLVGLVYAHRNDRSRSHERTPS